MRESLNVGDDDCADMLLRGAVGLPFKSTGRLEAENAALRHQLIVLQRKVRGRVRLTNSDRLFFIQLLRRAAPVAVSVALEAAALVALVATLATHFWSLPLQRWLESYIYTSREPSVSLP
jgi:hypothetical protein